MSQQNGFHIYQFHKIQVNLEFVTYGPSQIRGLTNNFTIFFNLAHPSAIFESREARRTFEGTYSVKPS